MEKNYKVVDERMIYRMPKEVDHHSAGQISGEIDRMIENYGIRTLVLDFTDTDFMDSSGIGLMIGRSRLIHFFQGEMRVCHLSQRLQKIFCASGLHKIISIEAEEIE